jgi:hypothetical protein
VYGSEGCVVFCQHEQQNSLQVAEIVSTVTEILMYSK